MFTVMSSIFRTILTMFITPDYTNMNINAFCADINIKNGKAIKKLSLDNKYKAAVANKLRPPLFKFLVYNL